MSSKNKVAYEDINTFSRTPSPAQLCSYVVIVLETVIFYLMVRPNLNPPATSMALTIVFSILLGISVFSSFLCSYIDPSDSAMI